MVRLLGIAVAALLAAPARDDDKKAREESAKKSLEDFKSALKEAKSVPEKARAILALGDAEWRDGSLVSPIARHLSPGQGDLNYLLPVAAAESLARFRGSAAAAQALAAALPTWRKVPYVHARVFSALGRVGHEAGLPALEEPLKGSDPAQAVVAVQALSDFAPHVALDVLFREYDRMEKKKGGASDELKRVYDRVQPEILKAVQKISGEKYPSMAEMTLWWQKRGPKLREEWTEREKARASGKRDPMEPKAVLPPALIVELHFDEKAGNSTANSGSSSAAQASASVSPTQPQWTEHAAPNGGGSAVDFGAGAGPYAVDLGGGPGLEHLKNLKSFTICGWMVIKSEAEGPADKLAGGGSRILSWLHPKGDGVELVWRTDGSMQLGVNQWADGSPARSSPKQAPLLDESTNNLWGAMWQALRFFAVTYDSTAPSGHVKFFVGSRQNDATLVNAADYPRGPAGAKIAPHLSVGNLPPLIRPLAPERSFRGILDELRIYGSAFDGSGALAEAQLALIQNKSVVEAPK